MPSVPAEVDAVVTDPPATGAVLSVGTEALAVALRETPGDRRRLVAVVPPDVALDPLTADPRVTVVAGAVTALPLPDARVDAAYVLADGLRPGDPVPSRGLAELHRVVRAGGAIHLEERPRGRTTVTSLGPPAIRIRGLRTAEAARVGELTLAAYDRYGRIEGDYRDFLADPLRRIDRCTAVLVAQVDGPDGRPEVVGTVSYVVPSDPEWEDRPDPAGDAGFRVLAVDPAYEGRGVGSALVDACIARAREDGAHRLLLISMAWMHRAHDLYLRRYGFVRRPDLDVRFPGGVGVILCRDLTAEAPERFPPPGPVPDVPPWFEDVLRVR